MKISTKLKQARLKANLTQELVAEELEVSRQTISNWENARTYPDINNILILSDLYGVTLDSLLKGDNEIIKHLKEDMDVAKSNNRLSLSILLAGIFLVSLVFIHIFIDVPRIHGTLSNIIAIEVVIIGAIISIVGTIDIRKIAQRNTSNKTLIRIAGILLYIIIYIPLVLVIPELISLNLQIELDWINGIVRSFTAIIFLIPAVILCEKSKAEINRI